jgi:hypothetical protein
VSAARPAYGGAGVSLANEHSREPSPLLPLLLLVIGLAVATVWFVALPAFHKQPRAERSCEVVVLKTCSTACDRDPTRGSRAVPRTARRSNRAKH